MSVLSIRFTDVVFISVVKHFQRAARAWMSLWASVSIARELAARADSGQPLDRELLIRCGYLK